MTKDFTKSQKGYIEQIKEDCIKQGRLQALADVERIVDKLKHSVWISKDILYDNYEGEEDVQIIDLAELKQKIAKLKEKK